MEQYKKILRKYLPPESVDSILIWLIKYRIHLHVSRKRMTKLGDFRPVCDTRPHKVTVNHNLNRYAFLITLIHEIAHVEVWEEFGNSVKPHGKEWKKAFRQLMSPFIMNNFFPGELDSAVRKYTDNALASSGSDLNLSRLLKKYDTDQGITLEELPGVSIFRIYNGRTFKKLEKSRKRYRCLCLDNHKIYLFNPMVIVTPVND